MHLSRVQIKNFRNLADVDIELTRDVVILGENRVGKSNFLMALRLVLDSFLPDSARQLKLSDVWDGALTDDDDLLDPEPAPTVEVHLDFVNFDADPALNVLLTDYRLAEDFTVARLSYVFKPKGDVEGRPTESDYEFKVFGGGVETVKIDHDVRRRISLDLLPALRDAEGDLATWRSSPLRPLIEDAIRQVSRDDLREVSELMDAANAAMIELGPVGDLENDLRTQINALAGDRHDIRAKFGFAPMDPVRLFRSIRILIDDGKRSIGEASLGSANLALLSLKLAEFEWRREQNERNYTLLAVEEPEAHLHPHLQRKVFASLFRDPDQEETPTRSLILTTHSPSIASVAPIRSIVVMRDEGDDGAKAYSLASLDLAESDLDDLSRYLNSTRAEALFARGIIFVEGEAEARLLPGFAKSMGHDLDDLGITVCAVDGVHFKPYVKLAAKLNLPFSVVTDWDPLPKKRPLGWARAMDLIGAQRSAKGLAPISTLARDRQRTDEEYLRARAKAYGIFMNASTFETEIAGDFALLEKILDVLEVQDFGDVLKMRLNEWRADHDTVDAKQLMLMIGYVGKGRFADELAAVLDGHRPPAYIRNAITHIVGMI